MKERLVEQWISNQSRCWKLLENRTFLSMKVNAFQRNENNNCIFSIDNSGYCFFLYSLFYYDNFNSYFLYWWARARLFIDVFSTTYFSLLQLLFVISLFSFLYPAILKILINCVINLFFGEIHLFSTYNFKISLADLENLRSPTYSLSHILFF